jgi:hypothetical protein
LHPNNKKKREGKELFLTFSIFAQQNSTKHNNNLSTHNTGASMKTSIILSAALLSQASAFSVVPSSIRSATRLNADPDISNAMASLDPKVLFAVAAAAVAGFVGVSMSKGDGDGKNTVNVVAGTELKANDVSIPYDSAARLAFAETGIEGSLFGEFQPLYLAKTVADVTAKKMARNIKELDEVAAKATKEIESLSMAK